MKTTRGVYYNLKESDYVATLNINSEEIKLYFSSNFNKVRFLEKVGNIIHEDNLKLSFRYKIDIDATKLILLSYYKVIEKRGFRVIINNKEVLENNLALTVI